MQRLKNELSNWATLNGKGEAAWRGRSPRAIADLADAVLRDEVMAEIVPAYFLRQKRLGDFLGVGESTVAGWVKAGSYPDYAKRATLAAFLAGINAEDLEREVELATLPRVVRDGDRWMVVRFETDAANTVTGEVVARDILNERDARQMVAGLAFSKSWASARDALEELHDNLGEDNPGRQGVIEGVLAELGRAAQLAGFEAKDSA